MVRGAKYLLGGVHIIMICSLNKDREMYEEFWQIYHAVELEVVHGFEQREWLPWIKRRVKGHGKHFVPYVPAAIFVPLISFSEPPPGYMVQGVTPD